MCSEVVRCGEEYSEVIGGDPGSYVTRMCSVKRNEYTLEAYGIREEKKDCRRRLSSVA